MTDDLHGQVRTYVRRQGRMTVAQRRALSDVVPRYEWLPDAGSAQAAFGRDAPLLLEIGFGMGHALIAVAQERPHWNCVGIDVYRPGIAAAARAARSLNLENVRLIEGDAQVLVAQWFRAACIDEIWVLFPDPWPKKRHHKRRLIQRDFVDLLAMRLRTGGRLMLATDWQPYAEHMLAVLNGVPQLRNRHREGFAPERRDRVETRFEARGERLGHRIFDLDFERIAD